MRIKLFINKTILITKLAFLKIVLTTGLPVNASDFYGICQGWQLQKYNKENYDIGRLDLRTNKKKCKEKLSLSSNLIATDTIEIPPARVISWNLQGESKTSVGGNVGAYLAFGVLGLFANAKNHDYHLTINGYDITGQRSSIGMRFKDAEQPKAIFTELSVMTKLAMGEKRPIKDIRMSESKNIFSFLSFNLLDHIRNDDEYPSKLY